MWVELAVMMAATLLVFILSLRGKLEKKHGFILIGMYVAFLVYLVVRTIIVR